MANPPKKIGFENARSASQKTGIHEKTLLKWARQGIVSCLKTGPKSIFFKVSNLRNELEDLYHSGSKSKRSKKNRISETTASE